MPGITPSLAFPPRRRERAHRDSEMKKNGFTLLEIIIVLALVTLILGLSSVFVAGFLPSAKANATGREISGMIRHARSLARLNRESRSVVIDLDNRTYGIEGLATKSFPPEALIRVIDPLSGEIYRGKVSHRFQSGRRHERGDHHPVLGEKNDTDRVGSHRRRGFAQGRVRGFTKKGIYTIRIQLKGWLSDNDGCPAAVSRKGRGERNGTGKPAGSR